MSLRVVRLAKFEREGEKDMNGRQRNLFERLVAFGFDRCEAEFHVKFREVSARAFLRGFRRPKRRRCWEPGCGELLEAPRVYCAGHEFRRTLGFDLKTYKMKGVKK